MKVELRIFLIMVPFFAVVGIVYGVTTSLYSVDKQWEPVGTLAVLALGGLSAMIAAYLARVSSRIDPRPEDDEDGTVEAHEGEYGVFSPWSWWPLAIGAAAGLFFLGLAIGWWLCYVALAFSIIALAGWVLEFSRGHHAH